MSSTVTAAFDAPSGVAEGNTVTFSAEFDPSNWTQIGGDGGDYYYDISVGSNTQWWETSNPVEYTISYSGGYSETGQITKIQVIDGGYTSWVDSYEYENYGNWSNMYWSSENDEINFYDGNNYLYEMSVDDDWNMSCADDVGTVIKTSF